jgi:hypothetical protein
MANVIEQLRNDAVSKLFTTPSMVKAWEKWRPFVKKKIGDPPDPSKIFDLGDKLREIMFKSHITIPNPTQSQTQGMKSRAGVLWESLLVWYCNLCMIGTRSVVIRKNKDLVPSQFLYAITADYGVAIDDSEADLIAITFPDDADFTGEIPDSFEVDDKKIKMLRDKGSKGYVRLGSLVKTVFTKFLFRLVDNHFKDFEMGIVSCKTPWNDFAVIPQHWDFVYSLSETHPEALASKGFSIGTKGYSINNLSNFFYAFVALPSQDVVTKPDQEWSVKGIKSNGMPVVRLRRLSGGNFWGLPSKNDVAESMKEIFEKNFYSSIGNGIESNLKKELPKLKTDYSYFRI